MISGSSSADTRTHTPPLAQLPDFEPGPKTKPWFGRKLPDRRASPFGVYTVSIFGLFFSYTCFLCFLSFIASDKVFSAQPAPPPLSDVTSLVVVARYWVAVPRC